MKKIIDENGVIQMTQHPTWVARQICINGIQYGEAHLSFEDLIEKRRKGHILSFEIFIDVLIKQYNIVDSWLRKKTYKAFFEMLNKEHIKFEQE